ncbi:MAG TPA: rod shape-determining protein MreC [Acidobacteriaceae bacterium]
MESFFSRYKGLLVLGIVLLAQLIALATQIHRPTVAPVADARSDGHHVRIVRLAVAVVVTPVERLLTGIGHGTRNLWHNYISLRGVRQHNHDLQGEVDRMRLEQMSLMADARQGQRLQKLLGFRQQYIYKTVVAQVIGTSGSDQSRVILIDKGANDGLKVDMPVITPDGIVGKVREVFPNSAQVLQINDQTAGAGVVLETTRIRGILRGNSAGQLQVIDLLPDDRIKPGERVLTSGGDQVYPRGLAVGDVQSIALDKLHPPYIALTLKPAANLSQLEEVLVITETSAALALSEATGSDAELHSAADTAASALPTVETPESATPGTPAAAPVQVRPGQALHPDRFTPGTVPPAAAMRPGEAQPAATQEQH